eukprot:TRINITY_DN5942_c0_g1_i1.p1 TRINITY_DN5942_c0_g1~~TRINITY_DN5942_c0_g1_i1.p1  ORF type:complete len:264 (-),score=86.18 TRINITY_DN5942_c0_g1_i1:405-1196(-)
MSQDEEINRLRASARLHLSNLVTRFEDSLIDDTRFERLLDVLLDMIKQSEESLHALLHEISIEIINDCMTHIDDRVVSVALRFLGVLLSDSTAFETFAQRGIPLFFFDFVVENSLKDEKFIEREDSVKSAALDGLYKMIFSGNVEKGAGNLHFKQFYWIVNQRKDFLHLFFTFFKSFNSFLASSASILVGGLLEIASQDEEAFEALKKAGLRNELKECFNASDHSDDPIIPLIGMIVYLLRSEVVDIKFLSKLDLVHSLIPLF